MAKSKNQKTTTTTAPADSEVAHSHVGASSCERWWNCPGSVRLIATLPDMMFKGSMYAAEGTLAHRLCEEVLKGKYTVGQLSLREGQTYMVDGFEVEITEEMVDAVNLYTHTITQDAVQMGFLNGSGIRVEQRFILSDVDAGAFGTNDAMLAKDFGLLRVYDFKYGAGNAVEVEGNKQMMYYALGAFQNNEFEEIELVIIQPRARHADGPVRRWRVTPSQLMDFRDELKQKVALTRTKDAPLCAGDWCNKHFCPARPACPQLTQLATQVAKTQFTEIMDVSLPDPKSLAFDHMLLVMQHADVLKKWLSDVMGFAEQLLESGIDVPGWKLVPTQSRRKWINEEEAASELELYLPRDAMFESKMLSPAQMEKVLKVTAHEHKPKEILESLVVSISSGTTLVPDNDPRAAITSVAHAYFEEIV